MDRLKKESLYLRISKYKLLKVKNKEKKDWVENLGEAESRIVYQEQWDGHKGCDICLMAIPEEKEERKNRRNT